MAATNWVCVALVLSLSFAVCSGKSAALSTMNDKSSISVITQQGNMSSNMSMHDQPGSNSSSSWQTITVGDDEGDVPRTACYDYGCDSDLGDQFCNLVESCSPVGIIDGRSVGDHMAQLREMVTELDMKVRKLSGGNHLPDAMEPAPA